MSKRNAAVLNGLLIVRFAFQKLKELCSNTPVLAYPDYRQKFKQYTDASKSGLGAVLIQIKEDNLERPVAYASRTLSKSE